MSKQSLGRFFMSVSIAVAMGLLVGPVAQAQEAGQAATQAGKARKAGGTNKKKSDTKKGRSPVKAVGCEQSGKKWADGKHCMVRCDEKGTMCDMRMCANGNWKNYGSCFGPSAVSPNCPPSCE